MKVMVSLRRNKNNWCGKKLNYNLSTIFSKKEIVNYLEPHPITQKRA